MGLLAEHKAERRARIARVAKTLVASHGYAGLTMRDLARAARVAVPTLYNLFGSKDAILIAELEASVRQIAARVPAAGESFFARGMAAFETGMRLIEESPEFYRATMQMFLTSPETRGMRQRIEEGYIAISTANLAAAKRAGQLAEWADPAVVARHMFALTMSAFLAWGMGELDFAAFRAAALSGCAHVLAGVARGAFAVDVEDSIKEVSRAASGR